MSDLTSQLPTYRNAGELLGAEIKTLLPMIQDAMFQGPRQVYPEVKFKQYFAPFFLGVFELPPQYNLLNLWVSEVGSYHVEVDIIDNNGNVLFTVPPVFNTNGININSNATSPIRFNGLEVEYKAEAMNNPEGAIVQYYNGISHKLGSLFNGYSPDPGHIDKWLKIFAFYNVTPPSPENARIVERTQQQSAGSNTGSWGDVGQLHFNPSFD